MMRSTAFWWGLGLLGALGACTQDDIGRPCRPRDEPALPTQTVGGESPVLEVVALTRSADCETFQCLTYGGYTPFCTRTCSYAMAEKPGPACTSNGECKSPQHCFEGLCRDDDCPSGFECRTVQDVGPLQGQLFCVYKEGCEANNRACEALGQMECRHLGCLDQTLPTGDTTLPHLLVCEPLTDLQQYCTCSQGDLAHCAEADLSCTSSADSTPFPADSVGVRDVCMRTD
jgi:hypothetical protein